MRLSRLYANRSELFEPITFNRGVSAVLAEIRVPANRLLDTHNLGKTTVAELLDFCLLKGKDSNFFLFKHDAIFGAFAFYLELELATRQFLTIRRPVDPGSRVDFLLTAESLPDARRVPDDEWDHVGLPFQRAKLLLDGLLNFDVLAPGEFRKLVGYLIRSQQDYRDVFQLGKFSGKHEEWKPFVAHLLGMKAQPVSALYAKRTELESASGRLSTLTQEWGGDEVDASLIDGLISVKRRGIEEKEAALASFDFGGEDRRADAELIDRTDVRITALNEERYRLGQLRKRIEQSLADRQIAFSPKQARQLFDEAGVAFGDQLEKDFSQLIEFNRAITDERAQALVSQRADAEEREIEIEKELAELNRARSLTLQFLRESDSLAKYKELTRDLAKLQADLGTLEAKRAAATRLIDLRRERRTLEEEFGRLQTDVEAELAAISQDETSRFGLIRRHFTEILLEVLGTDAILGITLNGQGGLDFRAEFVGESGIATSGDRGTSYRKMLCIAFDLAILLAYSDTRFPRFVYLDGALEQLEPRKRAKLIGVFRRYAAAGLQPVISLLDSDLPAPLDSGPSTLSAEDVVLTLHDEGVQGRLFKVPPW